MKVTLGVTGCIAAYKSALILRQLQEAGCEVFPVITRAAEEFIGKLTLQKLSGHPVVCGMFEPSSRTDIEHISLARKTDLLLVAPATANLLAKFATGICDDFLSTLYVSTTNPVIVAPGMNVEMWRHPTTQRNLQTLADDGVDIVQPEAGYLACGEVGEGRLADPGHIVSRVLSLLNRSAEFSGLRVLVTAGPTVEDLDPVRFISNRSSGKMGYALASEAARRGAQVMLVSGPTTLDTPSGVERISVRSAVEMKEAVDRLFEDQDIVIMSAAVGDYRPRAFSQRKIKKQAASSILELEPNPDILAELGRRKKDQFLLGFAAESESLQENGSKKLKSKNLDLLVANDISRTDAGFATDTNQVTVIGPEGVRFESELLSKSKLAALILDEIVTARLKPESPREPVPGAPRSDASGRIRRPASPNSSATQDRP